MPPCGLNLHVPVKLGPGMDPVQGCEEPLHARPPCSPWLGLKPEAPSISW